MKSLEDMTRKETYNHILLALEYLTDEEVLDLFTDWVHDHRNMADELSIVFTDLADTFEQEDANES